MIYKTELLNQISEFSNRVVGCLRSQGPLPDRSLWVSTKKWTYGEPTGLIIHYTANTSFFGTIRWFLAPELMASVSAHYVIGTGADWHVYQWLRKCADDLPLVRDLPAPIMETVPCDKIAWHATRANAWALGIELVNPGLISGKQAKSGDIVSIDNQYGFANFDVPQVLACGEFLAPALNRERQALGFRRWPPERILGHEHVQRGKTDPGPAFPLEKLRQSVCPDELSSFQPMPRSARREALSQATPETTGACLLAALGYHNIEITPNRESVWIFQEMMGLKVDSVLGPVTLAALHERWRERGFCQKG